MRTLIIYSSKYGAAKEVAEKIKRGIKADCDLMSIQQEKEMDLGKYDRVLLGTSVYAGQIGKELKAFCESHKEELLQKKVGAFFVCLMKGQVERYLKDNYGEELANHFYTAEECGGAFNVPKMNFAERMITRMVVKTLKDSEGKPIAYSKQMIYKDFNEEAMGNVIEATVRG